MTPFFEHPNDTPPSAGAWHNLGLLTASLAVMLVVAASTNLARNSPLPARPVVDPKTIPVYVELSSAMTASTETGTGDPAGSVETTPQIEQAQVSPTNEFNVVPLPEIPALATLPDVPAPKPDSPAPQPEPPSQTTGGTAPSTQAQSQPSTTSSSNSGTSGSSSSGTSSSGSSSGGASGGSAVQQLQFGVGAGRQPAPSYPSRALSRGHEGVVVVQFTVGESGKIEDATAVKPSRYPELNSAAISTIRRKWKFPAGEQRTYQIAINFQIR